jgi:hypothetical protein
MSKKLSLSIVFALIVSAFFSFAALANCGKPGCPKGQGGRMCASMGSCPHRADMQAAFAALDKDLMAMEKGIPAADQAAFMETHQSNLKKLLDTRAACMKDCKMKAAAPAAAAAEKAVPKA